MAHFPFSSFSKACKQVFWEHDWKYRMLYSAVVHVIMFTVSTCPCFVSVSVSIWTPFFSMRRSSKDQRGCIDLLKRRSTTRASLKRQWWWYKCGQENSRLPSILILCRGSNIRDVFIIKWKTMLRSSKQICIFYANGIVSDWKCWQ